MKRSNISSKLLTIKIISVSILIVPLILILALSLNTNSVAVRAAFIDDVDYAYTEGRHSVLMLANGQRKTSLETLAYWAKNGLIKTSGSYAINPDHACYFRSRGRTFVKTRLTTLKVAQTFDNTTFRNYLGACSAESP